MSENRFTDLFAQADAAFNGLYQKELNDLLGLSKAEIDAITPGTTDLKMYSVLIRVVEKASKENMSQDDLINHIKDLGEVAVKIAKKLPSFAALL